MEHDEHEMMVEYSEMAAFDFNSKEFQEVARDYLECKDMVSNFIVNLKNFALRFKPIRNY